MYSPKIREDYIPVIYRLAKRKSMRMTTLVNQFISNELKRARRPIKVKSRTSMGARNGRKT